MLVQLTFTAQEPLYIFLLGIGTRKCSDMQVLSELIV
jgi:hypothetical protein